MSEAIFPSQRNAIFYVEHCAVRASDERLVYVRKKEAYEQHFAIPNLNTAVLLMGPGTSITQAAARMCAEGNIIVGFCGGESEARRRMLAALHDAKALETMFSFFKEQCASGERKGGD